VAKRAASKRAASMGKGGKIRGYDQAAAAFVFCEGFLF
jgi:hypothetical protein